METPAKVKVLQSIISPLHIASPRRPLLSRATINMMTRLFIHLSVRNVEPYLLRRKYSTIFDLLGRSSLVQQQHHRRCIHLRGRISVDPNCQTRLRAASLTTTSSTPLVDDQRPPDPSSLVTNSIIEINEKAQQLYDWLSNKSNVLCLTGAGMSTESGIPDYRGHNGAYHNGNHQPMIHEQFMSSEYMRKRYWGRSMIGYTSFSSRMPNDGHYALVELERMNKIGVICKSDRFAEEEQADLCVMGGSVNNIHNTKKLSIITQNVDGLHTRSGSRHLIELHGNASRLVCMKCKSYHCRNKFHNELEQLNSKWLHDTLTSTQSTREETDSNNKDSTTPTNGDRIRPDGDANIENTSYETIQIPSCPACHDGILKPDVVFFGDTVPKSRVQKCYDAITPTSSSCDGLLCVGTSLAVHSAFRFVHRAASASEGKSDGDNKDSGRIPIAILNVGMTRAELIGMDVTKIESPIGLTLSLVVDMMKADASDNVGPIVSPCGKSINSMAVF